MSVSLDEQSLSFMLAQGQEGQQQSYQESFGYDDLPPKITRTAENLEEVFGIMQQHKNFEVSEGTILLNAKFYTPNKKEKVPLILKQVDTPIEHIEQSQIAHKEVALLRERVDWLEQKLNRLFPDELMPELVPEIEMERESYGEGNDRRVRELQARVKELEYESSLQMERIDESCAVAIKYCENLLL